MPPDHKVAPNELADVSGSVRQAGKAPEPKEGATRAAQPSVGSTNASAAATDEARARDALEGLKRIRAKARLDKIAISNVAPVNVRPAVIVAKPPPPRPAWVAPLAALAVAIGLVITACTGVIVYMTMQPSRTSATTSTEIRNLRDTVAQLRRQVSGVSETLDGLRTAVDLSSKATTDRFGRFADNLDRIERVSSSSTAKLDKLAQAQAGLSALANSQPQPPALSMPMVASAASSGDSTGSVSPPESASVPKKVVKGWFVRQAYEGIAILQGPNGVVEAVLGQQVPGLGHIDEIKNENGRLVVLSSAGAILSARKGLP